jgi:hypothetical protein
MNGTLLCSRLTRAALLVLALTMTATVMACAEASQAPNGEPSVRGVISDIRTTGDQVAILVAWAEGAGQLADVDSAHVAVGPETEITSRVDTSEFAEGDTLTPGDLRPGLVVEAWFAGAIAESYPPQARGSHVVVIGEWEGDIPTPLGLMPETDEVPEMPEGRRGEGMREQPAE